MGTRRIAAWSGEVELVERSLLNLGQLAIVHSIDRLLNYLR